ncbi:FAD-binding protein [Bacillus sp. ISL-7]|uniref:FAD-binding protein n=1 Tax=Bacillus sp. ISL-7 TaxID=2819136 RepID=UPI001BE9D3B4|nr:FAD-binding protein [Bacillus sp. ISL-7]MBT2733418.1 FAD-binding protein [Bacillus sp. ISL-7]
MYDVVVLGQGLSGLISAIWAKEQGYSTALVATGTGKIIQSTGVMDLIPGSVEGLNEWAELCQMSNLQLSQLTRAIEQFKTLTKKLGYPYEGEIEKLSSIVTGSGHVKKTALYPETISPLPEKGHVVIVGFEEVVDFQPAYIKGNLQKARPQLAIDVLKIKLGNHSQRTMTQLDAARLLDQKEIRNHCINQIKRRIVEENIRQGDMFIFPASLGVEQWKETMEQFSFELNAKITEAPGMPPNTTAIRLYERLKKEAVKLGVRFYADTTVTGCTIDGEEIKSLTIHTTNRLTNLNGKQFILATGGILGGGLEVTTEGLKDTALRLETDEKGALLHCPTNLYPVGASRGIQVTQNGITGGVFILLSINEMIEQLRQQMMLGGTRSA